MPQQHLLLVGSNEVSLIVQPLGSRLVSEEGELGRWQLVTALELFQEVTDSVYCERGDERRHFPSRINQEPTPATPAGFPCRNSRDFTQAVAMWVGIDWVKQKGEPCPSRTSLRLLKTYPVSSGPGASRH